MATGGKIIRVVIKAEDQVTAVFKKMQKQLDNLERLANSTNNSINRMTRSTTTQYSQVSSNISSATRSQHNLNNAISNGLSPAKALTDTIKTLAATYLGLNAAESIIKTSDMVTLTTARLDLFNNSLRTTEEQTDAIYQAAQRARGSYLEMVDLVSKYSAVAGDSFSSTDDVVAFTEILQKMFTVSGATGQEIYSASLQLKQALGTGRLMGEEFRAIMESAPLFGKAIAEYMTEIGTWGDVGIGDLKELASQSQITTDIMIGAMFRASDDINAKFEQMPYTFNQVWTKMKNTVTKSLEDVWAKLTALLSNGELDQFLNTLGTIITIAVSLLVTLFSWVVKIFNFISNNWSLIAPIIFGIVGAILAWKLVTMLATFQQWRLTLALGTAEAVALGYSRTQARLIALTAMKTGATISATAAQWSYNSALLACPLTWILLIIVAVIAVIYLLVAAINKLTGETISATGIIMGVITTALASAANMFIGVWNIIITIIAHVWDRVAMFANFFANVFTDPANAFKNLFIDAIVTILDGIKLLAEALDAVTFGALDASGHVSGWQKDLKSKKVEQKVVMPDSSTWADSIKLDYIDIKSAWKTGYKFGEGIDDKVGKMFKMDSLDLGDPSAGMNWEDLAKQYGDPLSNIAGDVSDIADGVNITNEDLKYLRQLAEQRAVNRFTTAEIKIDMNNSNTITGTQDIDGIVKSLEEKLYESMSAAAEGVHI